MVFMKTFCFYCSIRLGVIVSALTAMVESLAAMTIFIISGTNVLNSFIHVMQDDKDYSERVIIKKLLNFVKDQPENFLIFIEFILALHVTASSLAIIGAIKLQKWLLVPHIFIEFIRFSFLLTTHIILMIILKKILNLGILIAATIIGGFILLFLGYFWFTSLYFFHIISLVKSDEYKRLYGDDPLTPIIQDEQKFIITVRTMENDKEHQSPPPTYIDATMLKGWEIPKKQFTQTKNSLFTIEKQINEGSIDESIRQQYQNWYVNELSGIRRSNVKY